MGREGRRVGGVGGEGGREGGGREGGRRGRVGGEGREGGREEGRDGGREGGREGGRKVEGRGERLKRGGREDSRVHKIFIYSTDKKKPDIASAMHAVRKRNVNVSTCILQAQRMRKIIT